MSILLGEEAQPSTPSANKARMWLDSTTGTLNIIKDDGTIFQLEFNQDTATSLPAAPSYPALLWVQDTGVKTVVYACVKWADNTWHWEPQFGASQ
jgi:hypothetical protein